MSHDHLQAQEWSALLGAAAAQPGERAIAHLAQCRQCRQQLTQRRLQHSLQQARARLAPHAPASRAAFWPAVAASLTVAALLILRPWTGLPESVQMRAQYPRSLQALPGLPPRQNRGQPLRLAWTALPDALGYRVSCYRGADPAWLTRRLRQPAIVLPVVALNTAPALSVCRLDAELADGEWVLGEEFALSLTP